MLFRTLFIAVLTFIAASAAGQVYILDEQFSSAPLVPSCTLTGSGFGSLPNSSVANYGRNGKSFVFNATGQQLQYGPWTGVADHIYFFLKGNSSVGSSFLVEESADGTTWSSLGTVFTMTTGATFDATLQPTSLYIRLSYTQSGAATSIIDDLRIRAATSSCVEPPELLQVIIDGGCGTCESANEMIYFKTGGNPMDIRYLEMVFPTPPVGVGDPVSGCSYGGNGGSDNLNINWLLSAAHTATQTNFINSLNTLAGCPGVFVPVPSSNIIPAYSRVLAMGGKNCNASYNLSAICSLAPIYVIFPTMANCGTSGKFGNGGCGGNCGRMISIFNHQYGCYNNQTYTAKSGSTVAGEGYIFVGNNIGYTHSTTCAFMLLSVHISEFSAERKSEFVSLNWTVEQELRMDEYVVERSTDGENFTKIGAVKAINSWAEYDYSFSDEHPYLGISYYRLRGIDDQGESTYSEVREVGSAFGKFDVSMATSKERLSLTANKAIGSGSVEVYSATGQLEYRHSLSGDVTTFEVNTSSLSQGVHVLRVCSNQEVVVKRFVK